MLYQRASSTVFILGETWGSSLAWRRSRSCPSPFHEVDVLQHGHVRVAQCGHGWHDTRRYSLEVHVVALLHCAGCDGPFVLDSVVYALVRKLLAS